MIKIVTDSAADLPEEEAKALDIAVAPLFINFPEGEVSSAGLEADEFYNRLRAMAPEIPTTAQPSAGIFAELYRELGSSADEIISVHISSGLSGTVQAANLGSQQVEQPRPYVVDTLTLSGGERFQVLAAAEAARKGWSAARITERLAQIQTETEVVFTLETLTYLARGGRIGRVQGLAGALLKIKPVIHVNHQDGKYDTVGRGRTLKKSRDQIVGYLLARYGPEEPLWATVMHGQLPEEAEALAHLLQEQLNVAQLETLRVSPVLGVHTGPGVVGAAVVPMAAMDMG